MSRPGGSRAEKSTSKRGPRAPKWAKQGARFDAVLAERGIGSSDFASSIGIRYYNVLRWRKGYEFGPSNQAIAARALGLPEGAFEHGATVRKQRGQRERVPRRPSVHETRIVLDAFRRERPELAAALSIEDWRVIQSIRFYDSTLRPSVAFFETVAMALKGAIPVDEIASIARENAELDRTLAHKAPPKRR